MGSKWTVICLNQGSLSLKFALYRMRGRDELAVAKGSAEGIGLSMGRFSLRDFRRQTISDRSIEPATLDAASQVMLAELRRHGFGGFSALGHRIVHGGPDYMKTVHYRALPQVVCVDTAFHRTISELAQL
jgi:acetate kinase